MVWVSILLQWYPYRSTGTVYFTKDRLLVSLDITGSAASIINPQMIYSIIGTGANHCQVVKPFDCVFAQRPSSTSVPPLVVSVAPSSLTADALRWDALGGLFEVRYRPRLKETLACCSLASSFPLQETARIFTEASLQCGAWITHGCHRLSFKLNSMLKGKLCISYRRQGQILEVQTDLAYFSRIITTILF